MGNKKLIAIDIGNKTTKIVYGNTNKKNIVVNEYEIISTPGDCINDGLIINAEAIAKALSEAFKKNKMKNAEVVFNVSGTGVITRDIQLPLSTEQELAQILEFEAQQYFPVDLENYTVDFKILESINNQEGNFSRVLVVAAPNKQLDGYIQLSKLLKYPLRAIDIPSNSVLKLLSLKTEDSADKDLDYAIVDIGKVTSMVCILKNNNLKFSRILLNGSSEIDGFIANKFNIEYRKAEEIKIAFKLAESASEEAGATLDKVVLSDTIDNALNNIVSDISRFIEFFNSRESVNQVRKIYVCGGGSLLDGILEYFSGYFNMPVLQLPLQKEILYKGKKGKGSFEKDYIKLINAIGALIRLN